MGRGVDESVNAFMASGVTSVVGTRGSFGSGGPVARVEVRIGRTRGSVRVGKGTVVNWETVGSREPSRQWRGSFGRD